MVPVPETSCRRKFDLGVLNLYSRTSRRCLPAPISPDAGLPDMRYGELPFVVIVPDETPCTAAGFRCFGDIEARAD